MKAVGQVSLEKARSVTHPALAAKSPKKFNLKKLSKRVAAKDTASPVNEGNISKVCSLSFHHFSSHTNNVTHRSEGIDQELRR